MLKKINKVLAKTPQLQEVLTEVQDTENFIIIAILQLIINLLMEAERKVYLGKTTNNKANGYFVRRLVTSVGNLTLRIPRARNGEFRSAMLPKPYYRAFGEDKTTIEDLLLWYASDMNHPFSALDLHYSPAELEQLKAHYLDFHRQWEQQQLPQELFAIFIDVYQVAKKTDDIVYVIIGIDFTGNKDLLGIYVYDGSKDFWFQTLNQIVARGLTQTLMVICDDFPGITEAIARLLPSALHKLPSECGSLIN